MEIERKVNNEGKHKYSYLWYICIKYINNKYEINSALPADGHDVTTWWRDCGAELPLVTTAKLVRLATSYGDIAQSEIWWPVVTTDTALPAFNLNFVSLNSSWDYLKIKKSFVNILNNVNNVLLWFFAKAKEISRGYPLTLPLWSGAAPEMRSAPLIKKFSN